MDSAPVGMSMEGLAGSGIAACAELRANLHAPALTAMAIQSGDARLSADGALLVETGAHTGRSAQDKYVVDEPASTGEVWWGKINQKMSMAQFDRLSADVRAYLSDRPALYTQDLYAGADPKHRVRVRLVTPSAWHAMFARNMFIRPKAEELAGFEPDYVILHAPGLEVDQAACGTRTTTAVALSFGQKLVVIAGTRYAGEIKKSIFTVLNWTLPISDALPMHCSANIGRAGDVALFFGLSGTGKTTLSSDPARVLIGDDEHGWTEDGVFNFEGGCYAKVINLRREAEPEIWDASHRFGAVLENVVADANGVLDLDDDRLTENTRSCYPIDFIANARRDGIGASQPRHVVMLTADAFGVLPPISRLTPAQAMYHFLSGYTARVAGTEKGVEEPQATFSTCFGAPFLPRTPRTYGALLEQRLKAQGIPCWLVNTGWTGGAYGTGRRMSLAHTRAMLTAALSGALDDAPFHTEPYFGLSIPDHVEGVPDEVLDPSQAWSDRSAYAAQAAALARMFADNVPTFAEGLDPETLATGQIKAAA